MADTYDELLGEFSKCYYWTIWVFGLKISKMNLELSMEDHERWNPQAPLQISFSFRSSWMAKDAWKNVKCLFYLLTVLSERYLG